MKRCNRACTAYLERSWRTKLYIVLGAVFVGSIKLLTPETTPDPQEVHHITVEIPGNDIQDQEQIALPGCIFYSTF